MQIYEQIYDRLKPLDVSYLDDSQKDGPTDIYKSFHHLSASGQTSLKIPMIKPTLKHTV